MIFAASLEAVSF